MIGDGEVRAKQLKTIVVKLFCIVRDNNLENSKLIDNVLLYRIPGVPLSNFGERLCFYPLREVVNDDNQELSL